MYIVELSCKDHTLELVKTIHWEKVYAYILQNKKDIIAANRLLNSKLFVVHLSSEPAAWEVELE